MSNYWPTWNFPNCQTGRWTLVFSICGAFSNRGKGLIIKDHVLVSPRVSPQTRRRKSAMRLGLVNFIFVERCMGKNISNPREAHETDPKKTTKKQTDSQTVRQTDRQTKQSKQTNKTIKTNKQTKHNTTKQNTAKQNTTKHNKTKHNKTTHNKTKHNKTKHNNIKPTNQSINQTNKQTNKQIINQPTNQSINPTNKQTSKQTNKHGDLCKLVVFRSF